MSSRALFLCILIVMVVCGHRSLAADNQSKTSATHQVDIPDSKGNEFYRSVGKLRGALTCTAAFISTSEDPNAHAYLLTNGHCAKDPFPAETTNAITTDVSVSFTTDFNYFHDSKSHTIQIHINSIAYSTMKGIDLAVLKTDKTIGQMEHLGLSPYISSTTLPIIGQPIVISGIPIRVDALQNSYCASGKMSNVVEYYWHWYGMIDNVCEGVSSGSSGSPVFNASKEIIGIINTTNIGAVGETCYMGNPCAIGADGAKIDPGHNYVVPILGLKACFGKDGNFNLHNMG